MCDLTLGFAGAGRISFILPCLPSFRRTKRAPGGYILTHQILLSVTPACTTGIHPAAPHKPLTVSMVMSEFPQSLTGAQSVWLRPAC